MEGEMVKGKDGERRHVSMVGATEHRARYGRVRLGLLRERWVEKSEKLVKRKQGEAGQGR